MRNERAHFYTYMYRASCGAAPCPLIESAVRELASLCSVQGGYTPLRRLSGYPLCPLCLRQPVTGLPHPQRLIDDTDTLTVFHTVIFYFRAKE